MEDRGILTGDYCGGGILLVYFQVFNRNGRMGLIGSVVSVVMDAYNIYIKRWSSIELHAHQSLIFLAFYRSRSSSPNLSYGTVCGLR